MSQQDQHPSGTLRIAHFSDPHVLCSKGLSWRRFLNKRITGGANLLLRRSRQYPSQRFVRLLAAVAALRPTHTLCTGDMVNLALEGEFQKAAAMLAVHFGRNDLTLVPGNHDYYVPEAVRDQRFENAFQTWLPQSFERYPLVRFLDGVVIVGLNSAMAAPFFKAYGRIGTDQLAKAAQVLEHPYSKDRFRIMMLHHPPLWEPAGGDASRRLLDGGALASMIQGVSQPPHLVVHGHNHFYLKRFYPTSGIPVVQVASASRDIGQGHQAEFNLYCLKDQQLSAIQRHIYDPETDCFQACNEAGIPLDA